MCKETKSLQCSNQILEIPAFLFIQIQMVSLDKSTLFSPFDTPLALLKRTKTGLLLILVD